MKFGKGAAVAAGSAMAVAAALAIFSAATAEDVALPGVTQPMTEAAGAFDAFFTRAAKIDARFTSGAQVAEAVKVGAAYDPAQMEEGIVSYAAIAALQEPSFVAGVKDAATQYGGKDKLAAALLANPNVASQLPGAASAARLASGALVQEASALGTAGRAVKQSAYDVQHAAWSKGNVIDPAGRLARAKTLSATRISATPEERAHLTRISLSGSADLNAAAPFTPVVNRGLALAAITVLDQATEANADGLRSLMSEPSSAGCLRMAKLNLFQCLSVAKPHYEDIFCLGQHAMMDEAACVVAAAAPAAQTPLPTVTVAQR